MTGPARRVQPLTEPLDAVVRVPGSKSITNRALACAALAEGQSVLTGVLFADDTEAMLGAVDVFGAQLGVDRDELVVRVGGVAGRPDPGGDTISARMSGTTARFVAPLLAAGTSPGRLDADEEMRVRPMAPLIDALRALGGELDEEGRGGFLPLRFAGGGLRGGQVAVAGSMSSQFLSGLLMAGPLMAQGLDLSVTGELVSRPYLDMTIAVMERFGVHVETVGADRFVVGPQNYRAAEMAIEPDASAASYFFAAAAICGGRVKVEGLTADALQGDVGFVTLLERMGAVVERAADGIVVVGDGRLSGLDADLRHISDTAQTLAAAAVFADGPTNISGIGFIRAKETDRVGAVVNELRRCGIAAEELPDGLVVNPGEPRPATVQTYRDHRMAMSFSLLGLRVPGIEIADPDCVAKTFPDFWDVLDSLSTGGNASSRS